MPLSPSNEPGPEPNSVVPSAETPETNVPPQPSDVSFDMPSFHFDSTELPGLFSQFSSFQIEDVPDFNFAGIEFYSDRPLPAVTA